MRSLVGKGSAEMQASFQVGRGITEIESSWIKAAEILLCAKCMQEHHYEENLWAHKRTGPHLSKSQITEHLYIWHVH
jgi:hypothetical protein